MTVATMNIKDPEVRELAQELATRLNTSMTDAVRQALAAAVARQRAGRDDYVARVKEAARRVRDAADTPLLSEADLYDEHGLPR